MRIPSNLNLTRIINHIRDFLMGILINLISIIIKSPIILINLPINVIILNNGDLILIPIIPINGHQIILINLPINSLHPIKFIILINGSLIMSIQIPIIPSPNHKWHKICLVPTLKHILIPRMELLKDIHRDTLELQALLNSMGQSSYNDSYAPTSIQTYDKSPLWNNFSFSYCGHTNYTFYLMIQMMTTTILIHHVDISIVKEMRFYALG